MAKHFKTSLLLFSALAMTACASTATGKKASTFTSKSSAPQNLKTPPPDGALYAVIRYPAVVDIAAQDAYRRAYVASPIGGKVSKKSGDLLEAENMADSTIVKSNYFALSLYKELAARLPEHSVLLSPHNVKLAADGSLTSEPITKAETLPSIVTIDFVTYSFPDPSKMMGGAPLTFGDLITPLVVVRTDPKASVGTNGVQLASDALSAYAIGSGEKLVDDTIKTMQQGQLASLSPELDFIAYLSKDQTGEAPTASLSVKSGNNSVQVYPIEKLKMPSTAMVALNREDTNNTDPLETVFTDGFSDRIVDIIMRTPKDKASMTKRAAAIYSYDPSLAALTFAGSNDADYQARYNYVMRLLDAERKYLSVQSLRLFDGVHNGEMGAQVRDTLKTEYAVLEKRRDLARKQNQATAMAVLGAVATGVAVANMGGGTTQTCNQSGCFSLPKPPSVGEYLLADSLLNATIYAAQKGFAYNKESSLVGENYLTSILPALDHQTSVQVNMIDSNETITAVRFDDLKAKLKTLYSEKQRSVDVAASSCAFNTGEAIKTGTWIGVCEGGLASGAGAGSLILDNGTKVEYYGTTEAGQPHGPGYMIIHRPSSSEALEGNFTHGKADGAMRVSKGGASDSFRRYQAGADVGSASASEVVSPFTTAGKSGAI